MNLTNLAVLSITESIIKTGTVFGCLVLAVFVLTFVVRAESVRTQNNQTD